MGRKFAPWRIRTFGRTAFPSAEFARAKKPTDKGERVSARMQSGDAPTIYLIRKIAPSSPQIPSEGDWRARTNWSSLGHADRRMLRVQRNGIPKLGGGLWLVRGMRILFPRLAEPVAEGRDARSIRT